MLTNWAILLCTCADAGTLRFLQISEPMVKALDVSLAAASLFPQLKLLNSLGCALWYCRAHCPRAKVVTHCCINMHFPNCEKLNCEDQRTDSWSEEGLYNNLLAKHGESMEKHTMPHWYISSIQRSYKKENTIGGSLYTLTKDESRFFAISLRGVTHNIGINSKLLLL